MCYGGPPLSERPPTAAPNKHPRVRKLGRKRILQEFRTNPQYLLQSCLRYDWPIVEAICLVLIEYNERQRHVETSIAQVLAVDPWGNTPLQAACYFRPRLTIVRLLLKVASLYNVPMATTANEKGTIPLIIACSSGVTLRVIHELLEHDSNAVSRVDTDEATPFVALGRRYQMLRRVPKFFKARHLEEINKEMLLEAEECDLIDYIDNGHCEPRRKQLSGPAGFLLILYSIRKPFRFEVRSTRFYIE